MSKLKGKVAVVTGASKGIGAAIAKALGAEGASVVVNYASSKAGAETVVAAITAAGGKAVAVGGDVSKPAEAKGIIEAAIKNYGRLDVLVNNSGVYEFQPLEAVTEEQFHRLFNINVLGAILTSQAALKHLGSGGSIINIGSGVSRITPPNSVVYTATKGALDAVTGVLSRELAPKNIRVNSLNPGMVETEGTHTAASSAVILKSGRLLTLRSAASASPAISLPSPSSSLPTIQSGSPASSSSPPAACADFVVASLTPVPHPWFPRVGSLNLKFSRGRE